MGTALCLISWEKQWPKLENSPSDWECKPEDEDELECVVEGEPVHGGDQALKYSQERKHNPVLQKLSVSILHRGQRAYRKPLCVISLAGAEQCLEGVVTGDHESSKVDEKLASDVEEDAVILLVHILIKVSRAESSSMSREHADRESSQSSS